MNKVVLPTNFPQPLTIEKSEEYMLIKQYPNKLKLGRETARWMYDALKQADPSSGSVYEDGIGVLEVFKNAEGVHIAGVSSRFQLTDDAYSQIIRWMETYYFTS